MFTIRGHPGTGTRTRLIDRRMVDRIGDNEDDHRDDDAVEKDLHFQFSRRRTWTDFLEQQSASCRVFLGGKAAQSASACPDRGITISVARQPVVARSQTVRWRVQVSCRCFDWGVGPPTRSRLEGSNFAGSAPIDVVKSCEVAIGPRLHHSYSGEGRIRVALQTLFV